MSAHPAPVGAHAILIGDSGTDTPEPPRRVLRLVVVNESMHGEV
jgi:hypothetical protein